jgi:hypothetical protein
MTVTTHLLVLFLEQVECVKLVFLENSDVDERIVAFGSTVPKSSYVLQQHVENVVLEVHVISECDVTARERNVALKSLSKR